MSDTRPMCQRVIKGLYRTNCYHLAKVERDGVWYCSMHDPQKAIDRERDKARLAAWPELVKFVRRVHKAMDFAEAHPFRLEAAALLAEIGEPLEVEE